VQLNVRQEDNRILERRIQYLSWKEKRQYIVIRWQENSVIFDTLPDYWTRE
jgi:hypothetical protein